MFRKLYVFTNRKLRQYFEAYYSKKDIDAIGNKEFVIISNNCWGGALYRWYKRGYNSPFVGLFLYGPCYLKLLSNFDYYTKQKLEFVTQTKYPDRPITYPIALLDDIEIHFTHYETEQEAKTKWSRRLKRMLSETNKDNYYFKICDRERVSKEHLLEFHKLPYKNKISYSILNHQELIDKNHIKVIETATKNGKVFAPNGKKLFKLTNFYFNLNNWLLNKS